MAMSGVNGVVPIAFPDGGAHITYNVVLEPAHVIGNLKVGDVVRVTKTRAAQAGGYLSAQKNQCVQLMHIGGCLCLSMVLMHGTSMPGYLSWACGHRGRGNYKYVGMPCIFDHIITLRRKDRNEILINGISMQFQCNFNAILIKFQRNL